MAPVNTSSNFSIFIFFIFISSLSSTVLTNSSTGSKVILLFLFSLPMLSAENFARKEWELDARIIIKNNNNGGFSMEELVWGISFCRFEWKYLVWYIGPCTHKRGKLLENVKIWDSMVLFFSKFPIRYRNLYDYATCKYSHSIPEECGKFFPHETSL